MPKDENDIDNIKITFNYPNTIMIISNDTQTISDINDIAESIGITIKDCSNGGDGFKKTLTNGVADLVILDIDNANSPRIIII